MIQNCFFLRRVSTRILLSWVDHKYEQLLNILLPFYILIAQTMTTWTEACENSF